MKNTYTINIITTIKEDKSIQVRLEIQYPFNEHLGLVNSWFFDIGNWNGCIRHHVASYASHYCPVNVDKFIYYGIAYESIDEILMMKM